MHYRVFVAFLFSALLAAGQVKAGEVERWNRIATDAALAQELDPLSESRIFAIVHASIHDALNAIDRRYETYQARISAAPGASAEVAVAAAAHASLMELMPARKAAFEAALAETLAPVQDRHAAARGLQVGRQAAAITLAKRRDDGASRDIKYIPGKKAGEYRPTPPDFPPAAFAHWGMIRPFVLTSASQFRPVPPLDPKSARARAETEEVRLIGGKASSARTAEQSEISRYWYESSPQGWNRIVRVVAADRGLDEWESARLMALVNFAMADGFIGGFEAKYHYKYWRPATAIREDGGANRDWLPDLWTPPVPDYPSTHTVLGAAAAAVLARFFGTDLVSFSMTSGAPYPGITRKFWSFSEAARENGASRILAGIHFANAVQAGYEQGERIGAFTYERALRPLPPH
ncbi:MAG TPA: vanadium-dependent haloperoxidase [Burkholderiales bacterium]|nr:vanadium-dependent haloperoxidase [Burkholderiales bacterium]